MLGEYAPNKRNSLNLKQKPLKNDTSFEMLLRGSTTIKRTPNNEDLLEEEEEEENKGEERVGGKS